MPAHEQNESFDQSKTPAWDFEHLPNVGLTLALTAQRTPDRIAVAAPRSGQPKRLADGQSLEYDRISFAQLDMTSNQVAIGVRKMGVQPGTRLALMVPPGIEFVKMVFGLFKAGVTVILIDPGMGRKNMIGCLAEAKPDGIVGIKRAHLVRWLFRKKFPNCKKNVVVGSWPGCVSSHSFKQLDPSQFQADNAGSQEDEAAIIFTTGSTGPPKGVLYRHRNFIQQAVQIRDYFQIQPGSTDVSGFPLFALFNTAMGTTTVFPQMDATRPADVYPPNIIDAVNQFDADQSFGSPALWNTVSTWCESNQVKLPGIRRILSAGAPVPPDVLQRVRNIIADDGDAFTPYGATEALPVACNSASVVLNETAEKTRTGFGTCVGHKFERIEWRVIEISTDPLADVSETKEVPAGTIGELMVRGPAVTDRYVTRTSANADHKVTDGDTFWHRMGDVGYLDDQNRFWFCGRKNHRVITADGSMYTIPCEGIVNSHPKVYRSALVGVSPKGQAGPSHGDTKSPVIVVEPHRKDWPETDSARQQFLSELQKLTAAHEVTRSIKTFLFRQSLPVDIRHNSKIFREQLGPWAEEQL